MAELWDIARYVEEHPDDHEQRWRLAKKLYMAWEYRLALEHLQVLKNDWTKKMNVVRYLSATYYRLGRYDEAVAEIEEAIQSWPNEIGLREQLARVLEIAGRREDAAKAWKAIKEIDPHHPIAENALRRLSHETPEETPETDLRLGDSDSGIDLRPGHVCPNCGAQNSDEFDRCWQCHATLAGPQRPSHAPDPTAAPPRPLIAPETIGLIAGLTAAALIALGAYLSLRLLAASIEASVPTTFWDVYDGPLAITRVITGIALLMLWPISFWLAFYFVQPEERIPAAVVNLAGVLLGAFMYVMTWLPPELFPLSVVVPAFLALAAMGAIFRLPAKKLFIAWGIQYVSLLVMTLLTAGVSERFQVGAFYNPFTELPAIYKYASRPVLGGEPGTHEMPPMTARVPQPVRWRSTGSQWLDTRAGIVMFTVQTTTGVRGLKFEIQDSTGTRVFKEVTGNPWSETYPVLPGEPYKIIVQGPEGTPVSVTLTGLPIPEFTN